MLNKEQIIIFHTIKHSDSGLVVNGYSNKHGKSAYYYYASKANAQKALISPLSIIDAVVFYRHAPGTGSGLPLLKEIAPAHKLDSVKTDLYKSSIAIFICELLSRSIKEIEPNGNLFSMISASVQLLDALDEGVENFHLYFIANYCKIMGYMPNNNYSSQTEHFNFVHGEYVPFYDKEYCFLPENSRLLNIVLTTPVSELKNINCSGKARSGFLNQMIKYIEYHIESELNLKSLAVLSQIF